MGKYAFVSKKLRDWDEDDFVCFILLAQESEGFYDEYALKTLCSCAEKYHSENSPYSPEEKLVFEQVIGESIVEMHKMVTHITRQNGATSSDVTKNNLPPQRAEKLIALILSKSTKGVVLGDLQEEYETFILPKYGVKAANRWYWKQTLKSIAPILWKHCWDLLSKAATLVKLFGG